MSAALALRWRVPDPPIVTRWRGPAGMLTAVQRKPEAPIAAIVGPSGGPGPAGAPVRIDASLAATWILPHGLGRVPMVQAFLASGELIGADVVADASAITVTFGQPTAGFVLAS